MLPDLFYLVWLGLCALSDARSRKVANRLTLPVLAASVLARLAGLAEGPPELAGLLGLAALAGWRRGWVGGADVKVTVALALLDPRRALWAWAGAGLLGAGLRLARRPARHLPGMVGFWIGVACEILWRRVGA